MRRNERNINALLSINLVSCITMILLCQARPFLIIALAGYALVFVALLASWHDHIAFMREPTEIPS